MNSFKPLDGSEYVGAIITESTKNNVEFKVQSENKNGFVIAEGVIQEADEVNRNRRFYPLQELSIAINAPRQQELVSTGNFKGEAGHPLDQSLQRQSKIDPTNEQVWYTKLWMEGPFVKAHFRGTNNELGRSFNADLKDGQRPSFSLRALGSLVNENGRMTVRNMQIVTYDRVYFPSHSKAYTTKIVTSEAVNQEPITYYIPDPESEYWQKELELAGIVERGNTPLAESLVTPLTQQEINAFVVQESYNIKNVMNQIDVLYESINLSSNGTEVTMKTKLGDTIILPLDTAIQREIMNEVCKYYY